VPWGLSDERFGKVIEVWGNPQNPSQIRIEFDQLPEDDAPSVLLMSPSVVRRADVA
jgi:hypothetical protein